MFGQTISLSLGGELASRRGARNGPFSFSAAVQMYDLFLLSADSGDVPHPHSPQLRHMTSSIAEMRAQQSAKDDKNPSESG